MRRAEDFRRTVRRGLRVARPTVVLHAHRTASDSVDVSEPDSGSDPGADLSTDATTDPTPSGVRVGFVVSRAVGPAVRRNLVRRRLRHLVADRLASLPAGTDLVVRALPAAGADPDAVRSDLPSAWDALIRRWGSRTPIS